MVDINLVMFVCLKYIYVCWVLRIDVFGNCFEYEICLIGKLILGVVYVIIVIIIVL